MFLRDHDAYDRQGEGAVLGNDIKSSKPSPVSPSSSSPLPSLTSSPLSPKPYLKTITALTTTIMLTRTRNSMFRLALGALPLLAGMEKAYAGSNGLAITPQMGWNTWNHFGCDISEDTIVTAAQAFLDYNLTQYGYECAYSLELQCVGHFVLVRSRW